MIELRLLGPPEWRCTDPEAECDLTLGKPFAVLAYLALSEGPEARETLARMFWSDVEPSKARASARQALYILRRWLGEEAFASLDPVALAPGVVSTDVEAFRRALAAERIPEARALRRGPFFQDFALTGARPWMDWVEEQRDALDGWYVRALEAWARARLEGGEAEAAAEAAAEAVAVEPSKLACHLLRVEALLALGRAEEARAALAEARRHAGDLPGAPEALHDLEVRLRAAAEATGPDLDGRDPEYGLQVELVGRTAELAELRRLWAAARSGRAGRAVIAGPAGIGKTRLATEVVKAAVAGGAQVARVRCHRAERKLAWGAAAELVQSLMGLAGAAGTSHTTDQVLQALAPAGPGGGGAPPRDRGEATRRHEPAAYADAVLDLVRAVADEAPLVLFIDDLQWCDTESRTLLARVVRKLGRGDAVLVLMTTRDGLEAQDLLEGVESFLELGPLSPEEVREMVELAVRVEPPEATERVAAGIARASGGNPLFVGEVLRRFHDEGWITADPHSEGGWVLDAGRLPERIELPRHVLDVIGARMAQLPAEARRVCAALAGLGSAQPTDAVRAQAGLEPQSFLRAVSELLNRGVLEWAEGERLDFTHEHLREAAARMAREDAAADGGGPPAPWYRRRAGWRAASVVATLAVVAAAGVRWRTAVAGAADAPTYPYGRGVLIVDRGDSIWALRPPDRLGGAWSLETWDPGRWPVTHRTFQRLDDGSMVVTGTVLDPEDGPRGVAASGGTVRTLWDTPGADDGVPYIWPGAGFAVATAQIPGVELYTHHLLRIDLERGESTVFFSRPRRTQFEVIGRWSPDGSRFPVRPAGSDTLLLLTPDGALAERIPGPPTGGRASNPGWCDGGRFVATTLYGAGLPRPAVLDVETGRFEPVARSGAPAGETAACIGRYAAVAYNAIVEGRRRLLVVDMLLDSAYTPPPMEDVDLVRSLLTWLPDAIPPVPRALDVHLDTATLTVGQQRTVAARLITGRGAAKPRSPTTASDPGPDLAWWSSDPRVASVDASGRVTANRPGAAWIGAIHRDWLRDSVRVEVRPGAPEALLFHDDFTDLEGWTDYGVPGAAPAVVDGLRVLAHQGDGRYNDPLRSREAFDPSAGLTLEVSVFLKITRPDRQRFTVCLEDNYRWVGTPYTPTGRPTGLCLTWPWGEFEFRSLDRMRLVHLGLGVDEDIPVPSLDGTWTDLALQIQPDGQVDVRLNGAHVFTSEIPYRPDPGTRLHVTLAGAAHETELYFRDVYLWRGARW